MEFRLLGPVECVSDAGSVDLGRRRERGLLALLLLEIGQPVSIERLIDLLVGDRPPHNARKALQVDVSRLRRGLAAVASEDEVRLESHPAGYAIHVDPESVDVHRFTSLVDRARRDDDPAARGRMLRAALDLWRGPALADLVDYRACEPLRARLEEMRLAALELRVEADLQLGRHGDLVSELIDLTAQHPASERLVSARMLALYHAGRKREALDVYQRTADRLADDLGLDPGPGLQETHLAILRDDATLPRPVSTVDPTPPPVRPAQLPADLQRFSGRDDELSGLLARCRLPHDAVVISAIDGMAGVGKTALAIHVAHLLSPDYPDGQLFIDLNGFTDGLDPVRPGDALQRLLVSLGVPDAQIPHETADRAALYRSVLAGRRVLVLLDNAANERQVEPLLPPTSECLALVTSRSRLAGPDQATPLSLDVLPRSDATALFTDVVGVSRLADEPAQVVDEIVELCGRLPLAIRLAAARMRARSAWTPAYLLDRLRDEHRRLGELDVGDRTVAGAFDLSYRDLTKPLARMFRLLGLHPGPDISAHVAAALAGCPVEDADAHLDELLDVHLLQQHEPGRFRLHDLLRAYATRRAATDESDAERSAALCRLYDHETYAASLAAKVLYPQEASRRTDIPEPRPAPLQLADRSAARAWLDAEMPNLLAITAQAMRHGRQGHVIQLAQHLRRHLLEHGRLTDAEFLHTHALAAARELGDQTAEVGALNNLGRVRYWQRQTEPAIDRYEHALDLARAIDDTAGEINSLSGLGRIDHEQGRLDAADQRLRKAVELAYDSGDSHGEIVALGGLTELHVAQSRYDEAADCLERCLVLDRQRDDVVGEVATKDHLARVRYLQGQLDVAKKQWDEGLRRARELGLSALEFHALLGIGHVHRERSEYQRAAEYHQRALDRAVELGDRNFQFESLHGLGKTRLAAGQADESLALQQRALSHAEHLGQPYDRASALEAIAAALRDLGRVDEARRQCRRALDIFTDLDVPDAERARAALAVLDSEHSATDG